MRLPVQIAPVHRNRNDWGNYPTAASEWRLFPSDLPAPPTDALGGCDPKKKKITCGNGCCNSASEYCTSSGVVGGPPVCVKFGNAGKAGDPLVPVGEQTCFRTKQGDMFCMMT
jgi:hypothetical protein